jgi:hypothetical protein
MAAQSASPRLWEDEQLLARARELVERGWTQSALAEDGYGRQVEPWSGSAIRWSPLGALLRAWYERGGESTRDFGAAYVALALATGGKVAEWNAAPWRTRRHAASAFGRAREYLPEAREHARTLREGGSPS